jgi:hypothetical protein
MSMPDWVPGVDDTSRPLRSKSPFMLRAIAGLLLAHHDTRDVINLTMALWWAPEWQRWLDQRTTGLRGVVGPSPSLVVATGAGLISDLTGVRLGLTVSPDAVLVPRVMALAPYALSSQTAVWKRTMIASTRRNEVDHEPARPVIVADE